MSDNFIQILSILLIFSILLVFMYLTNKFQCQKTAKTLGYVSSYEYMVGCVIHKPDGSKILLKQMREINE